MNKDYNLRLDLQNRCNTNPIMEFDILDNDTSDFFILITKDGEIVDIEKAIVILAVVKPSGKVNSQFIEVKNNNAYVNLKPSMKDEVGEYTAKAMLILEDDRVVTDAINYVVTEDNVFGLLNDTVKDEEKFTLLTDMLSRLSTIELKEEQRQINEAERILSEENRKIEENKRVETELIRVHEEADRAKYEATRESNENNRTKNEDVRIENENTRIENEKARILKETKREEAEQLRKNNYNFMTSDEERRRLEANEYKEAESLRVEAETNRVNEEAKRRTTEQARALSENQRVSNEETRVSNELERKNNEIQRIDAENQRKNRYNSFMNDIENSANEFNKYIDNAKLNENNIQRSELERVDSENRRVSNELERISNENTRKANEEARKENETIRQNEFNNKIAEINEYKTNLTNYTNCKINEIETKVNNKINEIDTSKIDLTNAIDNKINEVETKFNSKINEVNQSKSDLTNKVEEEIEKIENVFNKTISDNQQNAEVIAARDGEKTLNERLERDLKKGKETYIDIKGSYISTDSTEGYLRNIEILGNTIQDSTNLADIRSVGDKVEGQELYKIPIVSKGKNLFNKDNLNIVATNCIVENNDGLLTITPTAYNTFNYSITLNIDIIKSGNYFYAAQKSDATQFRLGGRTGEIVVNLGTETNKVINLTKDIDCITLNFAKISSGVITFDLNSIQIEPGTQQTEYEPYKEKKLEILSPVQLEKVGDAEDRIIEKNGVWGVEKNIITSRLTSKLQWYTGKNDINIHYFYTPSILKTGVNNRKIICNNLTVNTGVNQNALNGFNQILAHKNQNYSDRLYITLDVPNVDELKKWLDDNHTFIKYYTDKTQFIPLPHDQQIKLKSFANKTNISFLTEIEGTIKAQTPRSIAASINTHTTQIDNLNKELDRVKSLEESKVSTVETESNFTAVEETLNGYFEDIKLEGKTLFNSLKVAGNWFDQETILQTDSTVAVGLSHCLNNIDLSLLKSNTVYTVIPFIEYKVNKKGYLYLQLNTEINGAQNAVFRITEDMFNKPTLITTKELTNKNSRSLFLGGTNCSYNFKSIKILMLEGDCTKNSIEYFEGLMSVGQNVDEISIKTINENLFNENNVDFSTIGTNYGSVDKIGFGRYKYIGSNDTNKNWGISFTNVTLPSNSNLYISCKMDIKKVKYKRIYIKSSKGNIIIDKIFNDIPLNFKTDNSNEYIINFYCGDGTVENIEFELYDICINNDNSNYKQNQSDKKILLYYNEENQTWEKPILRDWDTIEKHSNGKYYYHQRSGEIILNGTENWSPGIEQNTTNRYQFLLNNIKKLSKLLCDKFLQINGGVDSEGVSNHANSNMLQLTLNKDKGYIRQWLQANNVTVVYELSQEKIYECTNIDLLTYENETNYIIESGAITPKTTLKVHNNISNIVRLLQSKVSILENNLTDYMVTQNRLLLTSRYSTDTVGFSVNTSTFSIDDTILEYDNDLYNLILDNILVGKDNYNRDYMENLIEFYWTTFIISDEMYFTLSNIIEEQYTEQEDMIMEESPNE